jgi:PAT family beta-lactamase induction signal transducer AmpG
VKFSGRTWKTLGLLTTLYLSQGLPFGFFTQALPVLLRTRGVSLPAIGAAHLLALPWALKFLVAPLMDRWGSERFGRRRTFIVPLQFLAALACGGLALIDVTGVMGLLFAGVFLMNLLAALQDIATDGLAVELLPPESRGLGNGVQVAGYRVGMILGGGVLLIASASIGWAWTFVVMGLVLLTATLPIVLYREPAKPLPSRDQVWTGLTDWIRHAPAARWLIVVALYKFGDSFSAAMLRPFLVDQGYSASDIGWILGTLSFTTGLAGALAGGWVASRWGARKALIGLGALQSVVLVGYAYLAWRTSTPVLYAVSAVEHFTGGMATVSLFTAMMGASRPLLAATDYTVQASTSVIAGGIASSLSGLFAVTIGYPMHFLVGAFLSGGAIVFAFFFDFQRLWDEQA